MISVIIPAYNAEKYVERAIRSVQGQTYKDIEILVINDGSTDNTHIICKSLEFSDQRIKVFFKKNGGISSARNYGIDRARGEYIAFLDSDDEYKECFLEDLFYAINDRNADMAICGYYDINENSKEKVSSDIFDSETVLDRKESIKELIISSRFSSHPWNKLYRKKIFKQIRYPVGKNYEDMYIMPSILDQCDTIVFVPKLLVYYYQIETSITHDVSLKNECFAFEASYRRYIKYKDEYKTLYSYLIREPLEIALRIYTFNKKNDVNINAYSNLEKIVEIFLKQARKKPMAYKRLKKRYKIILLIYPILRNRVKYVK